MAYNMDSFVKAVALLYGVPVERITGINIKKARVTVNYEGMVPGLHSKIYDVEIS